MRKAFAIALAVLLWGSCANAAEPAIHIEDTTLFYQVYDAASGHPTAGQLQHDYIDKGTDGLRRFLDQRHTTAARIEKAISDQPQIYVGARKCLAALPNVRIRVSAALAKLGRLYPAAKFPPITIAVGRGKPVAIADETGVMIGLEALCGVTWMNPNIENRFTYVIAHEYMHVQQALASPAFYGKEKPTVLEESLIEGAAEFMGKLTSGGASYEYFPAMTKGREKQIETAFAADEDDTNLSKWLYNGTIDKPNDLGYWVGSRIVKSYYDHAANKRAAIRDIIEMKDAHAFLAKSGWQPGMIF